MSHERTTFSRICSFPRWAALGLAATGVLIFAGAPAQAAFPGHEGKIAFASNRDGNYEIYTMNADGTGQTRLTNNAAFDVAPAWSADGTKIAFSSDRDGNYEIYSMNSDGTGQTRLTNNGAVDFGPAWSPDGTKIAFGSSRDGNDEIYSMASNGSAPTRLTNNAVIDKDPVWSPDGAKIAFVDRDEIYAMNADGSNQTQLTNNSSPDLNPNWSGDGTKIFWDRVGQVLRMNDDGSGQTVVGPGVGPVLSPTETHIVVAGSQDGDYEIYSMNADGTGLTQLTGNATTDYQPDWQPVTHGYARPNSATPARIPLVPAYVQCTSPNARHKGALSSLSCSPPEPGYGNLTVGTPDFNGQAAKAVGYVDLRVFCNGGAANETPPCSTTPGDQLDGKVTISQTDVRCRASGTNCAGGPLSDYAGGLMAEIGARITDRNSGGSGPATVVDLTIQVPVPCSMNADSTVGSTCSTTTTLDALLGGASAISEGKRAIFQLQSLNVYNDGPVGEIARLFETGGLFFP